MEDEIHDSESDTADGQVSADGQPKRKRSRRGSRGGRKRRKPAANGEQVDSEVAATSESHAPDGLDAVVVGEPAAAPAPATGDTPPEYVPMSEWIEDFSQR
jgi:hypothetical protein